MNAAQDKIYEFSRNLVLPFLRPIKGPFLKKLAHPRLRKLFTSNFTSGYVAFGERNGYGIPPHWITIDVKDADFRSDIKRHVPCDLKNESSSVVYSSHMIEHLDDESIRFFLKDAFRILKPGGAIRLEAPDAEKVVDAYRRNDEAFLKIFTDSNQDELVEKRNYPAVYAEKHIAFIGLLSCYLVDGQHVPVLADRHVVEEKLRELNFDAFAEWCVSLQTPQQHRSGGHINAITFAKLERMLTDVGLSHVTRMSNRQTNVENLGIRGIERKTRGFYSIYVEATKPLGN